MPFNSITTSIRLPRRGIAYSNTICASSFFHASKTFFRIRISSFHDSFVVVKLNKNEFYNVIDRAALLTSEKDKNIVKFELNDGELLVSSNTPEIGKVEGLSEGDTTQGSSLYLGL